MNKRLDNTNKIQIDFIQGFAFSSFSEATHVMIVATAKLAGCLKTIFRRVNDDLQGRHTREFSKVQFKQID